MIICSTSLYRIEKYPPTSRLGLEDTYLALMDYIFAGLAECVSFRNVSCAPALPWARGPARETHRDSIVHFGGLPWSMVWCFPCSTVHFIDGFV